METHKGAGMEKTSSGQVAETGWLLTIRAPLLAIKMLVEMV